MMARISDVDFETIDLQRLLESTRRRIGPQVARDLEVRSWLDHALDEMVLELTAHLYAHRVDVQDVRVPFSKTASVAVSAPRWQVRLFGPLVALGMALGVVTFSLAVFGFVAVVALVGVVLHAVNPPREVSVTISGEVVVRREQFNSFPDNERVYPREFGRSVPVAIVKDARPEYRAA